jgi:lipopolysaccharide biosynthesis regulator YciM
LREAALEKLVYIYEREQRVAEGDRRAPQARDVERDEVQSSCALLLRARRSSARARRPRARSLVLKNTIRSETGQLRGALIRAGIAQEEREITQAIALYEQVIEKEHTFITEVLPPLVECYRTIDKLPYLDAKIENWVAADPTLRRDFAYAAIIANLTSSTHSTRASRDSFSATRCSRAS